MAARTFAVLAALWRLARTTSWSNLGEVDRRGEPAKQPVDDQPNDLVAYGVFHGELLACAARNKQCVCKEV